MNPLTLVRRGRGAVLVAVSCAIGTSVAHGQLAALNSTGIPISMGSKRLPCAAGFVVSSPEAGIDRNGDGDGVDSVWAVIPPAPATLQWLGIAAGSSAGVSGGHLPGDTTLVPLLVSEAAQGATDLNGDGDIADQVLFVYDTLTGAATSTGRVAAWIAPPLPDRSVLPFMVSETELGVDVDHDGHLFDWVAHGFDPATGNVYGTTATTYWIPYYGHFFAIDGPRFLYTVPEFDGNIDLNGDGDLDDLILHVHDVSAGTTTNLGVFGEYQWPASVGGRALVDIYESFSGGIDRNGDGDAVDAVLHVYDSATNTLINLGVAGGTLGPLAPDGTVPLGISEFQQGSTDLDGDQDATDLILFTFDPATLTLTPSTVQAIHAEPIVAPNQPLRWAVFRSEYGSFAPGDSTVDLNGDGDTNDLIAQIFTPSTGSLLSTRLAMLEMWVSGGKVGLLIPEKDQGLTDLNGDGDAMDRCVGVVDAATGETRVLPASVHAWSSAASGSHYGFLTDEFAEKLDLTGDGDQFDHVYRGLDLAAGTIFNTGIAGYGILLPSPNKSFIEESQGTFLLGTTESVVHLDLNGDGDQQDDVPTRFRPTVGSCGTIVSMGKPCSDLADHRPTLVATGCLNPSGDLVAVIRGGVPGKVAFFFAGTQPGMTPLPGGCTLFLAPPAVLFGPFPLTTQGLESGGVQLRTELPPAAVTGTVWLQAFVTANVPSGYLATNGLALTFSATP